jgi:hypothetical protein
VKKREARGGVEFVITIEVKISKSASEKSSGISRNAEIVVLVPWF